MNSIAPPRALVVVVCFVATFGGCATARPPTAAEIPALEARVEDEPEDLRTGLRLIAAYRGDRRYDAAVALVTRLMAVYPDDLGLRVLSGLLAEDRGEAANARAAYEAVLDADPGRALRAQVTRRLSVVRRAELKADVRAALEVEAELAQSVPDPATVGVFPFTFEDGGAEWAPLALALPALLSTDLGVTGRLTVVERLRVQALLDELSLGAGSRVEPSTAARGGRILGSGHIVQGRVRVDSGRRIAVDAAVVEVSAPGAEQVEPLAAEEVAERMFELEKQLAFDIHAELGVQLTPAERERINERQTESVEALLAFGRGLEALDAGDFALAVTHFAASEQLDPSFALARQRRAEAETLNLTPEVPTGDVVSAAERLARQRDAVQRLRAEPTSLPQQVIQSVDEGQRSVLAEVMGQDRIGQISLLELILRPPGGEE